MAMMSAPVLVLGLTSVLDEPTAGSAMVLVGAIAVAVVGFFWLLLWGFNDGVRLSVDGRKWRVRRRGFHALRLPGR
ncbi:hypothetical protein [Amycolatopsis pittospori]|uniref:hypothetical protein n=1 Tax=Amycolatopsis pittospori TaxID=2749434 RepID=UPI0015F11CE8|nr:hypothetical protein [Amycolatopsis pittospori]